MSRSSSLKAINRSKGDRFWRLIVLGGVIALSGTEALHGEFTIGWWAGRCVHPKTIIHIDGSHFGG